MNVESYPSKSQYLLCFFLYIGLACVFAAFSPQAQIVALWPSAGVALVGCLIFGAGFLPAVFLGSILFNSGSAIWHHGTVSTTVLQASAVIALGSILQAWVNFLLLRYRRINILNAPSHSHVSQFILIALGCCLISATIGNSALAFFYTEAGELQVDVTNLLIWWGGDFLGVILVTPLLLGLLARQSDKAMKKRLLKSLSVPLLLIIIALQMAQQYISHSIVTNMENSFSLQAEALENKFQQEMKSYTASLDQLSAWLAQRERVDHDEFVTFTQHLMAALPGIKAMSWNPLINTDDVAGFERAIQQQSDPDFHIKGAPLLPTDPLVVVQYIEPLAANRSALGFNVFSNPARKKSMQMAKQSRTDTATDILQLVQLAKNEPGFLIFSPVFKTVNKDDSSMSGLETLTGFAVGVFQVADILDRTLLQGEQQYIDMYIYENGNPLATVYGDIALLAAMEEGKGLDHQFTMRFANHGWTFNLHLTKKAITALQVGDMLIFLAVQVVFGVLAVFIILSGFGYHEHLSRLVDSRTNELKRVNAKLHHYAFYDSLTGLANRRLFLDRLKQSLSLCRRNKSTAALLYMDLNGFKAVNDTLGHECGDQLLKEVSRRFNGALRSSDTLARLGGDEFTLLLPNHPSHEDVLAITDKLTACLHRPIVIGQSRLMISNSIGVAFFPKDGDNLVELVAAADAAMYEAKKRAEPVCFYSPSIKSNKSPLNIYEPEKSC